MIDNSPSMAPKQARAARSFPELVERIQTLATSGAPASFHIGVVDSDLGAGPFTLNQGQCHPDGDGGRLRTAPRRVGNVPAACATLQLGNGDTFIDYDSSTGADNLGGVDLATAFTCLADVGEIGLRLRASARVGLPRADDADAQSRLSARRRAPGRRLAHRRGRLLGAARLAPLRSVERGRRHYGVLHSFRCTQFGITCDGNAARAAARCHSSDCAPATGRPALRRPALRQPVQRDARKRRHQGRPGGRAARLARRAAVAGRASIITAPVCRSAEHAVVPDARALVRRRPSNAVFFGDPAVRIHALMSSTANSVEASICDTDYIANARRHGQRHGRAHARPAACRAPSSTRTIPAVRSPSTASTSPRCSNDGRLPCWDLAHRQRLPGAPNACRRRRNGCASASKAHRPPPASIATCPLYEPTS